MQQYQPGEQLGPYRVEALIGAGGMGQVYRARDTRLGRAVAIKKSAERFGERFEREARAISSLTHANICTLYDVGPDYLVMELIEGETLADRLARGPLSAGEALELAAQIAAALEAAHEQGIVHRDLKPANVKITPAGAVKVLDFGLAKMVGRTAMEAPGAAEDLTRGIVLGTSGYMAPEQMQGKSVDKRADIWAFGVLVYEMLTGRRPFRGGSDDDALTAVLASEPDWEPVPLNLRRALRRCLERDPRRRLRDIGDFALLVEDLTAARFAPPAVSRRAFAGAFSLAAGAAAFGAWGWLRPPRALPSAPARFAVTLPAGVRVYREALVGPSVALSPTGDVLVIATTDDDGQRLYLRRIDDLVAVPLAGTEGASSPFFSPDGSWIGFFAEGRLRRVPASGGAALDIGAAPGAPLGGTWSPDDRIVFAFGWRSPLHVVSAQGGEARPLIELDSDAGERYQRRPEFLPGGRFILFESGGTTGGIRIDAFDSQTDRRTTLTHGVTPRYAASGHLLAGEGRSATLLATRFDVGEPALTGSRVPVLDGVQAEAGGTRHYAIARDGTLAYVPDAEGYALVLVDLGSRERRVLDQQRRFHRPRFSPGGQQLAVGADRSSDQRGDDVWIYDVGDGSATRLTFNGGTSPVWSSDGDMLAMAGDAYWTGRERNGIYTQRADGRGDAVLLRELPVFHRTSAWSGHGIVLELATDSGELWIELVSNGAQRRLAEGFGGSLSPDQRWLAYLSDASGRRTVYVTPFPEADARWAITEGASAIWGATASELYYVAGDRLMGATLDFERGPPRLRSPRLVLEAFTPPVYQDYDVSRDGRTLVAVLPVDPVHGREVVVALDWSAELRRAAGR